MLDNKTFAELNRPVGLYPVVLIAGDWLLLSMGIYLLIFPSLILNFLGLIIILRQQLALSVMMHEGVHYSIAKNKVVNDLTGIFFCSGPILSHFNAYRTLHMKHHRHTLSSEDPGQYLLSSQNNKKSLLVDVLKDLSGMTYFSLGKKAKLDKLDHKTLVLNLAGQVFGLFLVWTIFKFFNLSLLKFLIYYVLPLVTIHQLILRVRALMEHGGYEYNKDASLSTRTVAPGLLSSILAPHNINFHIEHHLYPTVPGCRLKIISEKMSLKQESSYVSAAHDLFITGLNK